MSVKSRTLAIVVFRIEKGNYQMLDATPKIELTDSDSQSEMKLFKSILEAFISENHIEMVYLKKRAKKGEFSGGGDGFKIEAILQIMPIPLHLISPQTIASVKRKTEISIPESLNKYQIEAFETAYCAYKKNA